MPLGPAALKPWFSSDVRSRGEHYFHDGRVRLDELNEAFLCGTIRGSRAYRVAIRCDGATLRAACECPFAADNGQPCKHLWAALITADAADALGDTLDRFVKVNLSLEPVEADEEVTVAVEIEEADDEDEDEDEENYADDAEFELLEEMLHERVSLAGVRHGRRRASWRDAFSGSHFAPRGDRDLELVVFVDVADAFGGLVGLHLGARRIVPAGRGPLEPLGSAGPDRFADPLDRQVFELGAVDGGRSMVFLGPEMARRIVPELCRAGRMRVLSSKAEELAAPWRLFRQGLRSGRRKVRTGYGRHAEKIEHVIDHGVLLDLPAVSWDAGGSFEVALHVEPVAGKSRRPKYVVRVVLVRGDERIDAREPLTIDDAGLVYFADRIAAVELGPDRGFGSRYGWLALARRAGDIVLTAQELEELMAACFSDPAGPVLELPAELGYEEVRAAPVRVLEMSAPSGKLVGKAFAEYDGARVPLGTRGQRVLGDRRRVIVREPAFEEQARSELARAGFRGPACDRQVVAPYEAGEVSIGQRRFAEAVFALVAEGWKVLGEGLRYRAATAASARVVSGVDWFSLEGSVSFGDVEIGLPELLRALRKQRERGTIALGDGSIGVLPEEWLARFGVLADAAPGKDGGPIQFSRGQVGLVDACLALVPDDKAEIDARFAKLRDEIARFERIEPARPARSFRAELRPYQSLGLGWLSFLEQIGFGGCLADDMGLGKTVQILALLHAERRRSKRPSLVVVPKSLVFNWQNEARRFAPELRVRVHAGAERSAADGFAGADLVLTTYGTLRRDVALLSQIEFERVILDEAQAIKNAASATAKAARCLRARQRLALSGTPIENHLGELVSLFDFLNPGMFAGLGRLQKALASRNPDARVRELIRRAVRPFLLRRTKSEVAPELPERTEQTLVVELDPEHRALYDELLVHYRASLSKELAAGPAQTTTHVLEALLRLRQAACHPGLLDTKRRDEPSAKLDLLLDKLGELVEEGHKALVFSQFTSLLELARARLDEAGIAYEYLDGKTKDRQQRVERFQSGAGPSVFLLSLKAGGVGLNLTAADYVFILDPWWNPAAEAQAIDRTHRIGQTRSIMAYRILAADTVEERVAELQEQKRELVSAIIGESGELATRLTREDLEHLLGLGGEAKPVRRRSSPALAQRVRWKRS